MTNDINRATPNGPGADGTYSSDSAPNTAPTPAVPQPVAKPGFNPGHVASDDIAAAQATRSTPPQPGNDSND
jgi:hypothetical protein